MSRIAKNFAGRRKLGDLLKMLRNLKMSQIAKNVVDCKKIAVRGCEIGKNGAIF